MSSFLVDTSLTVLALCALIQLGIDIARFRAGR